MEEQFKVLVYKYWCQIYDEDELHLWMKREMDESESPHLDMYSLNAKKPYEAEKTLLKIAEDKYNFKPVSIEGVRIGKKVFYKLAQDYLNRKITPHQLNSVINKFDNFYDLFGGEMIQKACIVDDDVFWGDLWNCFDGMWDEKITYENSPHIDEELKKCLNRLKTKLLDIEFD